MKKNRKQYPEVEQLPANALTVAKYASLRGCTTPYIYELVRKGKADFEIVVFQGINFVVGKG